MPLKDRPDDSSGRGFLEALRMVEPRPPAPPLAHLDVVWWPEQLTPEAREQRAVLGDYLLLVIVANEEFLANEPPQMPRVSWAVYRGEDLETLVGGAAPSVPVAKARAEALWRAFLGYKRS